VPALGVAAAVVTHAATPPSCRQPQATAEVAALGVTVTLALYVWMDTHNKTQ